MKYYEFKSDPESVDGKREILKSYLIDMSMLPNWPDDMSKGDRLIAWLLIVQIHALACQQDNDSDEGWKG